MPYTGAPCSGSLGQQLDSGEVCSDVVALRSWLVPTFTACRLQRSTGVVQPAARGSGQRFSGLTGAFFVGHGPEITPPVQRDDARAPTASTVHIAALDSRRARPYELGLSLLRS